MVDSSTAPADSLSDTDLVEAIRRGERTAEAELVQRYSSIVMYMIRRSAPDLAEDVHQETFHVILVRLRNKGIDDPSMLGRFIVRTARNLLYTARRKSPWLRAVREADDVVSRIPDESPGPFEQISISRRDACVRRLLEEMSIERDREILQRFYIAGLSKEQICNELTLDALHFNRVLYRAKQRFKALLLTGGTDELDLEH